MYKSYNLLFDLFSLSPCRSSVRPTALPCLSSLPQSSGPSCFFLPPRLASSSLSHLALLCFIQAPPSLPARPASPYLSSPPLLHPASPVFRPVLLLPTSSAYPQNRADLRTSPHFSTVRPQNKAILRINLRFSTVCPQNRAFLRTKPRFSCRPSTKRGYFAHRFQFFLSAVHKTGCFCVWVPVFLPAVHKSGGFCVRARLRSGRNRSNILIFCRKCYFCRDETEFCGHNGRAGQRAGAESGA